MSTSPAPARVYGISATGGASQYWSNSNNYTKTGPKPSGWAIPAALANTIENDLNGDGIADEPRDVGASFQNEISLAPGATETLRYSIVWGDEGP